MRLKPTPLTEASLVFSISWMISLILSVFVTDDFNQALGMASGIAILYLILSFSIWAISGLAVRGKSAPLRFFVNITGSSLVAIAAPMLVDAQLHTEALTGSYILMSIIYFFGTLGGAALTFFLVTKPKKNS